MRINVLAGSKYTISQADDRALQSFGLCRHQCLGPMASARACALEAHDYRDVQPLSMAPGIRPSP